MRVFHPTLQIIVLSYMALASKQIISQTPQAIQLDGMPTSTSITVLGTSGVEYSIDNGITWQESTSFAGLTPNTQYLIIARYKATETALASPASQPLVVNTDKTTPNAPSAPVVAGTPTDTSITVETIPGAEYSIDGGNIWQDNPVFEGLSPNTEYTIIARIKATDNGYSSPISLELKVTTAKQLMTTEVWEYGLCFAWWQQ